MAKILRKKVVYFKNIYNVGLNIFTQELFFCLLIRNIIRNKKFYFAPNLCEIRKNVREENCLFEKYLQINFRIFFHESYIFSFIHQKRFHENKKFNFTAKIYEIQGQCSETKLLIPKRFTPKIIPCARILFCLVRTGANFAILVEMKKIKFSKKNKESKLIRRTDPFSRMY